MATDCKQLSYVIVCMLACGTARMRACTRAHKTISCEMSDDDGPCDSQSSRYFEIVEVSSSMYWFNVDVASSDTRCVVSFVCHGEDCAVKLLGIYYKLGPQSKPA